MATVNEIVTKYKTQGSEKVVKETQQIGKAQTRLGQASASAGRSFSAQANGLGGLVGVYAAAAANVFAISAAFAALNRAAQFETIIRGTEQLASAVGSSATIVVEELKRVTQGQLSVIEAATSANLALSAGFNTDQIAQLGEVANKAAKALGRNLTDAFQRITRGAIKLEPELLDEIGIFTRINPALEAYALQLGKSVSQLTQFERRQAFVNQVIKDGQQAFQDVDISGKSTQATFEALVANFTDLALVVGGFVADSLVPLAEFLDKNLGNRLILLGGIATLVFSALGKAIGGTAVAAFTQLGGSLDRLADKFSLTKAKAAEFAEQGKKVASSFAGQGLVAGPRGVGAGIKRDLAAGPLSTGRAIEIQEQTNVLLDAEKAKQAQITEELKKQGVNRDKLKKQQQQSVNRVTALESTQKLVTKQIDASGKASIGFARGLRAAGNAAAFVARGIGAAFGILQALLIAFTTLQTILSFFDVDLFDTLKTLISGVGKELRDAQKGMATLAEKTGLVKDAFAGLNSEVSKNTAIEAFTENVNKSENVVKRFAKTADADAEKIRKFLEGPQGFFDKVAIGARFLTTDVGKLTEKLEELEGKSKGLREALKPTAKEILSLGSAQTKLEEATKKSADTIAKSFDTKTIRKEGKDLVATFGDIDVVIGKFSGQTVKLSNDFLPKLGQNLAEAQDKADDLFKKLLTGAPMSAERVSRDFGTIISKLEQQKKIAEEAGDIPLAKRIGEGIDQLSSSLGETVGQFTRLDSLIKQIGKEGSSSFKFLDDVFFSGKMSAETGKVAKNQEEELLNRQRNFALLQQQLKDENDIADTTGGNLSNIRQLEEAIGKQRKIALAQIIQQVPVQEKLRLSLKKQNEALDRQIAVAALQNEATIAQLRDQAKLNQLQSNVETRKNALNIQKARLDLIKEEVKLAETINKLELTRLQNAEKLRAARAEAALDAARDQAGLADKRANLEAQQARNNVARFEKENILSRGQIVDAQAALVKLEKEQALDRLDRQEGLIILESAERIKAFEKQRSIIEKQLENDKKANANQQDLFVKQEAVRKAEIGVRKAQEEAQIKAISNTKAQAERTKEIADLQAKNQRAARDSALDILKRNTLLQANTIKGNREFLKGEQENIKKRFELARKTFTGPDVSAGFDTDVTSALTQVENNIAAINAQFEKSLDLETKQLAKNQLALIGTTQSENQKLSVLRKQITANAALDKISGEVAAARLKQLKSELDIIIENAETELKLNKFNTDEERKAANRKLEGLKIERELIQQNYEEKIKGLVDELSYQQRLTDAIGSSKKIVQQEMVGAFMKLNTAIIEGTLTAKNFGEGFKDFIGGTLKKVQADFFQKTIAEPASEFLTDSLFSAFGLQSEKKGADALTYTGDAANVHVNNFGEGKQLSDLVNAENTSMFNNIKEKVVETKDSFFSFLGGIAEKGKGVFSGLGDLLSGAFSSITGMFSGGSSGASSILGAFGSGGMFGSQFNAPMDMVIASGGKVPKMAAGGMTRDRVPALLEPGEFVMKRSSARSIGESNLQSMNSTGQMGGNVSVNIVNQGTPQEATEQSQPKFDGEKFVIDIVTRDLRNNGPIRKSLRGAG